MRVFRKDIISAMVLFALISIVVYMTVRAALVLYADYSFFEKSFSIVLILGEFFILVHSFGYALNILKVYRFQKEDAFRQVLGEMPSSGPEVAVLVAARHEPREVLEETFASLYNLKYKNKKIYFLDDSSDEKYLKEAEGIAEEFELELFRRKERHGAKAGIVNDCLKGLRQKYIAVFDADQTPLPEFLNVIIPSLENDEKLAFVQTPQFYTNVEESRVARGAAFQQAVFYEYICEGKNSQDAMFCCGTNIVFRRQALLDVGGLDESTITEDFATSIKLHTAGWKSLYYNHVYAFGMAPENLSAYFNQQYRWANGTISVFKKIIWQFIKHPFSLKLKQWWEYFLSGSYYMIGTSFFVLMLCPVLYLLFNIPSFFARPEIYFLTFLPYITLSLLVFYMVLGRRNYTIKDLFLGQLLGVITFSVYMRAFFSALIGVKTSFGITSKAKEKAIAYIWLWPQLMVIVLSYIS
ncbi:MAG: glycosyltransferase, partial [Candidatus Omnitrophica bacterium]|nr:glycosyltransferase [Candidatus Omnitrophota bacterium]